MRVFLLAIVINLVIRCISTFVVNRYVKTRETDDKLLTRPGFHAAVIIYLINVIVLKVNVAILIALAIKEYIL